MTDSTFAWWKGKALRLPHKSLTFPDSPGIPKNTILEFSRMVQEWIQSIHSFRKSGLRKPIVLNDWNTKPG
jgi:hypothetical protein